MPPAWDFKFTPAMADLIQTKIIELLPTIEYGIEELNIISYYSKDIIANSYEPSLVEMYKEYIVVYPNCPNKFRIDEDGPTEILMKDMEPVNELNLTFISITSHMQEYNYIENKVFTSDYTWNYTKYDKEYFMSPDVDYNIKNNRTYFPLKELNQKNTLYRIITTIGGSQSNYQLSTGVLNIGDPSSPYRYGTQGSYLGFVTSPTTTSEVTYNIQCRVQNSKKGAMNPYGWNCSILAMEIKG